MSTTENLRRAKLHHKVDRVRNRLRGIRRGLSSKSKTLQSSTEIIVPQLEDRLEAADSSSRSLNSNPASSSSQLTAPIMDGTSDKKHWRSRTPVPVSAIFVHAGAGYHSTTNEHVHLSACNDAAKMAISILRAGGTAVDAVEAAIKVLEDNEITNSGYGSNLTIEGVAECDATIVDHFGRSGACGATPKILNPIQLARIILETSSKPLSLRRVPPNLLVGDGAADFAAEHGMSIVPYDAVISKVASDRFKKWSSDLQKAESAQYRAGSHSPASSRGSHAEEQVDLEYEERVRSKQRRDHTMALLSGTWNEGQPDSPHPSPFLEAAEPDFTSSPNSASSQLKTPSSTPSPTDKHRLCAGPPSPSRSIDSGPSPSKKPRYTGVRGSGGEMRRSSPLGRRSSQDMSKSLGDIGMEDIPSGVQVEGNDGSSSPVRYTPPSLKSRTQLDASATCSRAEALARNEDLITDTVGAIAIDMYGSIAAGSSSGGIGMKHRGRVGPAALVGVGTAVIPVDPEDDEEVAVAAVTSGTGEHMATTMASQKCAERLYFCTKRGLGGTNDPAIEDDAIESFVEHDFMDHPGVKHSNSTGAIGVMAVKKTAYGFYLHFAHNTDSFALASMHSNERQPKCVMSRMGETGAVTKGARKIRIDSAR